MAAGLSLNWDQNPPLFRTESTRHSGLLQLDKTQASLPLRAAWRVLRTRQRVRPRPCPGPRHPCRRCGRSAAGRPCRPVERTRYRRGPRRPPGDTARRHPHSRRDGAAAWRPDRRMGPDAPRGTYRRPVMLTLVFGLIAVMYAVMLVRALRRTAKVADRDACEPSKAMRPPGRRG